MEQARINANAMGYAQYDGAPCKHGHGTARYVSSGRCVICSSEAANAHYKKTRALLNAGKGTMAATEAADKL